MFSKNPTSWLSIYDDNSNKILDDQEIQKITWGAAAPPLPKKAPAKPKGVAKPKPKK